MPECMVATPLKISAVRQPYTFEGGISIRQLTLILWDQAIVRSLISGREREEISDTAYWLCTGEKEAPFAFVDERDGLYETARLAMHALQIVHPLGGKNVYLKFQVTPKGYDNIGSQHHKEMNSTLLGRITSLENEGLAQDFEKVKVGDYISHTHDRLIVEPSLWEDPRLLAEYTPQALHKRPLLASHQQHIETHDAEQHTQLDRSNLKSMFKKDDRVL